MNSSPKRLCLPIALFVAIEITLGVLLQITGGTATVACSWAAVWLACLFCAAFAEPTHAYLLTQLALVFTVAADYFLVVADPRRQLPAMLCFSVTQLAYFLRILDADTRPRRRRVHLICRASLSAAAILLTLLVLGKAADAVALVSMFYYANLILNLLFATLDCRRLPLLAVGLALFLLCDTVIGLDLLNTYLPIPEDAWIFRIIRPGFNLAWAFYLPAQTLLAISLLPDRCRRGLSGKKAFGKSASS